MAKEQPNFTTLAAALANADFATALQRKLQAGENGTSFYDTRKDGSKLAIDGIAGSYTRQGLQKWVGAAPDGDIGPKTEKALRIKLGLPEGAPEADVLRKLQADLQQGGFFKPDATHTTSAANSQHARQDPVRQHPTLHDHASEHSHRRAVGARHRHGALADTHRHVHTEQNPPAMPQARDPILIPQGSRGLIILDSGHGDHTGHGHTDPGAVRHHAGQEVREAELNARLTRAIQLELQKSGYTVMMSNDADGFRQAGSKKDSMAARTTAGREGDAFVSIHHNVGGGQEIIYQGNTAASRAFGQAMGQQTGIKARADNRGLAVLDSSGHKRADGSMRSAILVEAGSMERADHCNRVNNPQQCQQLARQFADAIIQSLETPGVKLAQQATSSGTRVARAQSSHGAEYNGLI